MTIKLGIDVGGTFTDFVVAEDGTPPRIHKTLSTPHDPSEATGERQYNRRWWVGGHWRQQACGPNHSQRKPIYVAPYIKGPEDKPLSSERVNVWRR